MTKKKRSKKKSEEKDTPVDTKWVVRVIVVVALLSVGLFIYFRQKAKERYERTSAEQQAWLAEEQGKINLTCTGLFDIGDAKYALYANSEDGQRLVTEFDLNLSAELVKPDGTPLPDELSGGNADSYSIKALKTDGAQTEILTGETVLNHPNKEYFASAEGVYEIKDGKISFPEINLPEAPSGWKYSVWIALENESTKLNKILTGGEAEIPSEYLGKSGAVLAVAIEPNWYEGEEPFPFAILGASIPQNPNPNQNYNLVLGIESLPYCVVSKTSPWVQSN